MTDVSFVGDGESTVFCQISGREISPESCSRTQGQDGCFGCASPRRQCEKCHQHFVAVPATGTCSHCTALEIEAEKVLDTPEPPRYVQCQLMRREVAGSMCRTMQGQEKCRGCQAASRLCETCGKRPVRFPSYGLCFTCSVVELGEGWNSSLSDKAIYVLPSDEISPAVEAPVRHVRRIRERVVGEEGCDWHELTNRAEALYREKEEGEILSYAEVSTQFKISQPSAGKLLKRLSLRGVVQKLPSPYRKRWVITKAASLVQEPAPALISQSSEWDNLVDRAHELVVRRGHISYFFLKRELHISYDQISTLVLALETRGVIKRVPIGKGRTIRWHVRSDASALEPASDPTSDLMTRLKQVQEKVGASTPDGLVILEAMEELGVLSEIRKILSSS